MPKVQLLLLAATLLAAPSCAQEANQSGTAAEVPDRLTLLFASDKVPKALPIPIGEGRAKVCANPDGLMTLYPGRGVLAVTGAVPFAPASEADTCNVEIVTRPALGELLFSSQSCQIRTVSKDRVQVAVMFPEGRVSPADQDAFLAAECFYRLAMVSEGFSNGFSAPVFGKFPSNVYFVGKRSYVGDLVTPLIRELIARCPDLTKQYYRHGLEPYIRRNCYN